MTWTQYLTPLLKGAQITVMISLTSIVLGTFLAFLAGIARTSGNRIISGAAFAYVLLFRGTPLLVQLFWFYYALPLIGISFDPITTGITVLALLTGAFGAEVVRGALLAVPQSQHEAARALNFSKSHTLWHISMPQAIIEMMPAFGNLAVQNLKDTALVSLISIADLTFQAQSLRNITLDSATIYTLTLIGYFIIALGLMVIMRFIEAKLRRGAAFPRSAHS
ncbi:ectoine/hydroxyectoine ABC transporter permease subunit EhuC [Microvirga ossetica]|jgi:polar amino acid transport system permease protein|uniref:Ectoine/hydroxyectoine ABC transporter permease subunit EhuC n=1 Tax=Microvirga ossetica TaxID=1882682 RepID=A0A1B2EM04_9HYPH|nr:ectoine/hydroxyectoine ABC transporter permease subunit EhuC [Microvirga ossetica]ANY81008.1 ectoine/hydroxyectoine ABC transporter permease subunit EhuC [Microvirga ossetica]